MIGITLRGGKGASLIEKQTRLEVPLEEAKSVWADTRWTTQPKDWAGWQFDVRTREEDWVRFGERKELHF